MWKDAVLSDFKYNLDIWPEELTIATSVRRKWLSRQLSGGTDYSYVCPEELTIATTVRRKWLSRQLSGGTIPASVWRNYTSVCLEELYQRLSGGTIPASVWRKWLSRHMSGGTIPASLWRNYTSVCPEEVTISAYVRRNYSCVCLEELYQRLSGGTDYSYVCPEELTIPTFVQRNRLFWHLPGENDNPDVCPGKQKKNNKNYQSELFFSSHFRITAQEGVFPCAKAPCSEDVLVNEI